MIVWTAQLVVNAAVALTVEVVTLRVDYVDDPIIRASALVILAVALGVAYAAHVHVPVSLGTRRTGLGGACLYVAMQLIRAALTTPIDEVVLLARPVSLVRLRTKADVLVA